MLNWGELERAGLLTTLDRKLGEFLGGQATLVGLGAALVSRNLREGHVCLELARVAEQALVDDAGQPLELLPALGAWRAALEASDAVETVRDVAHDPHAVSRPLVLDAAHRLYFRRYFEHEQRLALSLTQLATSRQLGVDQPLPSASLDHYFGSQPGTDGQRRAAEIALTHKFVVISGGPGTGKTATVVKILALLVEQAFARSELAPRMLLLAPTGKAAARLKESIGAAKGKLGAPSSVLDALVDEASTIHRALGVRADSRTRFRRSSHNPLPHDVVLVDEASMVDLSLMRHLVEALRPDARLILLGDRFQLASVQAGSVLSELCSAFSVPGTGSAASAVVELTKSYRFAEDSGIFAFANAVRQGHAERALALLDSGSADLGFHDEAGNPETRPVLRRTVEDGFAAALGAASPAEALAALGTFRVLCAHRKGPFGVEDMNQLCRGLVVGEGGATSNEFFRGQPLLVTQNDYAQGLYNGDLGVVWPDEQGRLAAYFDGAVGPRRFSLAHLPEHETAFAITIHKSQGSEYDEVVVLLPERVSQLLSRELLYTAVTRARRRVVVSGGRVAVEGACRRSIERSSGLSQALTQLASSKSSKD